LQRSKNLPSEADVDIQLDKGEDIEIIKKDYRNLSKILKDYKAEIERSKTKELLKTKTLEDRNKELKLLNRKNNVLEQKLINLGYRIN